MKRVTAQLTAAERQERLRQRCIRLWREVERDRAAEAFEEWIGQQRDAVQLRKQLLGSSESIGAEDLKPVWSYWRDVA